MTSASSRCPQCLLTREAFQATHKTDTGLFAKHCNFCLGLTDSGDPVHTNRLLCPKILTTDETTYKHYDGVHKERISQTYHQKPSPQISFPKLSGLQISTSDMAPGWPVEMLWETKSIKISPSSSRPTLIEYRMRDILEGYQDIFKEFFDVDAISVHGHVSDALNPYILCSLIQHLSLSSSEATNQIKVSSPRLAVMDDLYGAGSGPLAYHAVGEWCSPVACGEEPIVVAMDPQTLGKQLQRARAMNCIGFWSKLCDLETASRSPRPNGRPLSQHVANIVCSS